MKFITEKNYKRLMIIPIIMLVIFLFLILVYPGVQQGIDLKGGNQLILRYDEKRDFQGLDQELLNNFSVMEAKVSETVSPTEYGLLIEYSHQPDIEGVRAQKESLDYLNSNIEDLKSQAKSLLDPLLEKGFLTSANVNEIDIINNKDDLKTYVNESIVLANDNFNSEVIDFIKGYLNLKEDQNVRTQTREVSATLGDDFVKSSVTVGLFAFIFLVLVILFFFKEIVPSGLIIFSAIFDVLAGLAGMALLGLSLSLTTIPALLMLVGYCVDTNILLSTRLLKQRKGDVFSAANNSMSTGLTMTFTTLATVVVMMVISYFTQMYVILEIATILFFGLIGDLFSTWCFNGPVLIRYILHKNK
jgi:preprotein translocase subunit SecF